MLDVIHHANIALPLLAMGVASIHRRAWIRLFYRTDQSDSSMRAWERFKRQTRDLGLAEDIRPLLKDELGGGYAGTAEGYLHVHVARAYDAVFAALGAPHPGGEEAEIEALERQEQERARAEDTRRIERLLASVDERIARQRAMADLASVLRALETKRAEEESSARHVDTPAEGVELRY